MKWREEDEAMSNVDDKLKQLKRNADLAITCLNVVTLHVYTKAGEHFTVEALPWKWLETAKCLAGLSDIVKMFATHAEIDSDGWWEWKRPEQRKGTRKAA